eukprot:120478-Rhodomonas_salina.2
MVLQSILEAALSSRRRRQSLSPIILHLPYALSGIHIRVAYCPMRWHGTLIVSPTFFVGSKFNAEFRTVLGGSAMLMLLFRFFANIALPPDTILEFSVTFEANKRKSVTL